MYRARLEQDDGFRKTVAIKMLRRGAIPDKVLGRFRDEARVLGMINDRAVVGVDQPTQLDGRWAIVMEWVDGVTVRDLLRNGASATERGRHDTTALHWAAAANEAAIVRELLDHGADPDARAADGCSALHYAAREDAAEAVNALLAGGADARLTNREGRTPLQEVYDEEDEDGAATARALRDGEKAKALFLSLDGKKKKNATPPTEDSRSVGACTKDSDVA